jgi:hypothetical protein
MPMSLLRSATLAALQYRLAPGNCGLILLSRCLTNPSHMLQFILLYFGALLTVFGVGVGRSVARSRGLDLSPDRFLAHLVGLSPDRSLA